MKCPECGFEGVLDNEKFCGECGANVGTIESKWDTPKWKWGSLIVSTVLVFLFWSLPIIGPQIGIYNAHDHYEHFFQYIMGFLLCLAFFGFPTVIYLMYKERTHKINYGLAWITFPLITLLLFSFEGFSGDIFIFFIILVVPAIIIDIWYVKKLDLKE